MKGHVTGIICIFAILPRGAQSFFAILVKKWKHKPVFNVKNRVRFSRCNRLPDIRRCVARGFSGTQHGENRTCAVLKGNFKFYWMNLTEMKKSLISFRDQLHWRRSASSGSCSATSYWWRKSCPTLTWYRCHTVHCWSQLSPTGIKFLCSDGIAFVACL